jgi:hypothetical protein
MKATDWSRDLGVDRDRLYLELLNAPFDQKVAAYESLKRRYLGQVKSKRDRLEIRRRTAESLLLAAAGQPWHVFARYLRRLQRLGFSTPDRLVLTCHETAMAARGNATAKAIAQRLIARTRRTLRTATLPKRYRMQEQELLLKAEQLLKR